MYLQFCVFLNNFNLILYVNTIYWPVFQLDLQIVKYARLQRIFVFVEIQEGQDYLYLCCFFQRT